jgi:DNA-directed RNA polymerase sigma subunit (sigma70/sigma32)
MVAAAQGGDLKARDGVVAAVMPYIHFCVANKLGHHNDRDPMYADCVQASIAGTSRRGGLLHAIDIYNSARGVKFLTHAHYWIRAAINDTAADHMVVGIRVRQRHAKIRRVAHELGDTPSVDEVRDAFMAKPGTMSKSVSRKSVAEALSSDIPPGWTVQGLDAPELDRESVVDEDTIIDAIDRRRKMERLVLAIQRLPKNEAMLVEGLFGFGGTPYSIRALASDAGVSKATIIRRRNTVLEKLKALLGG